MIGISRNHVVASGIAIVPLVLSSCTRAPSFDILGSFFPAWLVCFAAAIVLTVIARFMLMRLRISLALPSLIYPCLTASCTFALWLLFFR
jgi:YtcA family